MRRVLAGLWMAAAAAWGVTCPAGTTHILGTAKDATGTALTTGWTLYARGPSAPIAGGGLAVSTVAPIAVGSGGTVEACLVGGVGYRYDVTYQLVDAGTGKVVQTSAQRWFVPRTSRVLALEELRDGADTPSGLISSQRLNPGPLGPGQVWAWDGLAWTPADTLLSGFAPESTWAQIESGTAGTGHILGSTTWDVIEGL